MYRDLIAWQKSYRFALNIYKVTRKFPKEELFGITSQMRRAATSISVNIAEGSTRQSKKEFHQFLCIAQGSTTEEEVWLSFSHDLGYITSEEYDSLREECTDVGKLLTKLINSMKS
jgi:four helix bundle protein